MDPPGFPGRICGDFDGVRGTGVRGTIGSIYYPLMTRQAERCCLRKVIRGLQVGFVSRVSSPCSWLYSIIRIQIIGGGSSECPPENLGIL